MIILKAVKTCGIVTSFKTLKDSNSFRNFAELSAQFKSGKRNEGFYPPPSSQKNKKSPCRQILAMAVNETESEQKKLGRIN
jgi:hypothetical protein